jgi:hypothetical protein
LDECIASIWRAVHDALWAHNAERLFYNRRVPLPLSLAQIEARLSGKYYRQLSAVVHDLQVIAENAVMFNGADSGIAQDAKGAPLAAGLRPSPLAATQLAFPCPSLWLNGNGSEFSTDYSTLCSTCIWNLAATSRGLYMGSILRGCLHVKSLLEASPASRSAAHVVTQDIGWLRRSPLFAELRDLLVAVAEGRPFVPPSSGPGAGASSRSTRAAARIRHSTEADPGTHQCHAAQHRFAAYPCPQEV